MIRRLLILIAIAYAALCGWVTLIQRGLLYFPTHRVVTTRLETWIRDGEVVGYKREVSGAKRAWLFTHGNSGQAVDRESSLRAFDPEDSVYILEYPGFGGRAGKATQETINTAAREAFTSLWREKRYRSVGVVGESLGSGPASYLATLDPAPSKVILLVPYDDIVAVAGEKYPWLPTRLLMFDQWNNSAALKNYPGPVEIYAASRDDVIPNHHARRLHERLPNSKLVVFEGGHGDWATAPEVKIAF